MYNHSFCTIFSLVWHSIFIEMKTKTVKSLLAFIVLYERPLKQQLLTQPSCCHILLLGQTGGETEHSLHLSVNNNAILSVQEINIVPCVLYLLKYSFNVNDEMVCLLPISFFKYKFSTSELFLELSRPNRITTVQ